MNFAITALVSLLAGQALADDTADRMLKTLQDREATRQRAVIEEILRKADTLAEIDATCNARYMDHRKETSPEAAVACKWDLKEALGVK
ncbi:hypothetical protein IB277_20035 [Ensifer sp. ENS07]|uniref:hypothetical protein n=1 Tax=Ensifer sp. ENS07 TaxID=2769274 RepID=UPI001781C39D|nr:hypothetical protein [Ensifer sp. ENS07]MBD9638598.1 hypothetical protein [Ensifer sp. ENS07]